PVGAGSLKTLQFLGDRVRASVIPNLIGLHLRASVIPNLIGLHLSSSFHIHPLSFSFTAIFSFHISWLDGFLPVAENCVFSLLFDEALSIFSTDLLTCMYILF
ncbi:Uncharacterized protein TCM_006892, partial [Theobroma cacao]